MNRDETRAYKQLVLSIVREQYADGGTFRPAYVAPIAASRLGVGYDPDYDNGRAKRALGTLVDEGVIEWVSHGKYRITPQNPEPQVAAAEEDQPAFHEEVIALLQHICRELHELKPMVRMLVAHHDAMAEEGWVDADRVIEHYGSRR